MIQVFNGADIVMVQTDLNRLVEAQGYRLTGPHSHPTGQKPSGTGDESPPKTSLRMLKEVTIIIWLFVEVRRMKPINLANLFKTQIHRGFSKGHPQVGYPFASRYQIPVDTLPVGKAPNRPGLRTNHFLIWIIEANEPQIFDLLRIRLIQHD